MPAPSSPPSDDGPGVADPLDGRRAPIAPPSHGAVGATDPCSEGETKPKPGEPRREVASPQESPRPIGQQYPLEPARDIGWLITVLAASSALLGSWTLFPNDAVGNGAGSWVSGSATVAILGAMWLRTSHSAPLGVAITALSGGVLLLLGAVRDYPTAVTTVMVTGGAGIVLGAVLQAGNRQQSGNPCDWRRAPRESCYRR